MSAEVFQRQQVRLSFMHELMNGLNLGVYRVAIEREMEPLDERQERIHSLSVVYMVHPVTQMLTKQLLMLTNLGVYALAIPGGQPAYFPAALA